MNACFCTVDDIFFICFTHEKLFSPKYFCISSFLTIWFTKSVKSKPHLMGFWRNLSEDILNYFISTERKKKIVNRKKNRLTHQQSSMGQFHSNWLHPASVSKKCSLAYKCGASSANTKVILGAQHWCFLENCINHYTSFEMLGAWCPCDGL